MKAINSVIALLVLLCLLITVAFTGAAAEDASGEPEVLPEPTPWTGDVHWYTFQIIGDSGLISSTRVRYFPLNEYYYVTEETAVAIGKVKGMTTDVKVYTNDPEERVIWSLSPGGFYGIFIRSDTKLPEPGLENGNLVLLTAGRSFNISSEAQAELYGLLQSIQDSGKPVDESGYRLSPDGPFDMEVIFDYSEIPGLGKWMDLSITRYEDRLLLLSWTQDSQTYSYQMERVLEIDPESETARTFFELLQATDQAE